MDIYQFLELTITKNASDLHFAVGFPPMIRIDGTLYPVSNEPLLTNERASELVFKILTPEQKDMFLANKEIDFSFALENRARFRVNGYFQKGFITAALRFIPYKIQTIDDLNLPKICHTFAKLRQGFVLIVGPTGHGKSTTIASIVNEINLSERRHILTIEDPIEYVYPKGNSLVSQREMHVDTLSWTMALRSALREDPDVVVVGEMRDYETIAAAMTVAETGHLVFATLHTNSASQTIDRIVDVFPEDQQEQVRMQLSATLEGVISQRLIPTLTGGRVPSTEIMIANSAVRNVIREGRTHLLDNIIQTSGEIGMETLEMSLYRLLREGKISLEMAQMYAFRPEELMRLFRGKLRK